MRININKVKKLMIDAHDIGYEPILTINGEFYSIDYNDKPVTEADKVRLEGRGK